MTDFEKICRTCAKKEQYLLCLFKDKEIPEMLMAIAAINIAENDGFPSQICSSCINQVYSVIAFKNQCEEANKRFSNSNEIQVEIKYENSFNEKDGLVDNENATIKCETFVDNRIFVNENNKVKIKSIKCSTLNTKVKNEDSSNAADVNRLDLVENHNVYIKSEISVDNNETDKIPENESTPETATECQELINSNNNKLFKLKKSKIEAVGPMTKNKNQKDHACPVCQKVITYCPLEEHMNSHTKEKPFQCHLCSTRFSFRSNLRRHMDMHSSRKESWPAIKTKAQKKYSCPVCHKEIKYVPLKEHMNSHTKEKPFQCHLCSIRFSFSANLRSHMRLHSGKKPYICEFCGKQFLHNYELVAHVNKHENIRAYKCKICGKDYLSKVYLKRHEALLHREKAFVCSVCGKSFAFRTRLNHHLRTHTGEKPYACEICAKRFAAASAVILHKRTHTGERPHLCELCNKRFAQLPHLKRHLLMHKGEKRYQCTKCERKFASNHAITVHMRMHTGIKPYKCSICNRGFYDPRSLKTHEMKKHS